MKKKNFLILYSLPNFSRQRLRFLIMLFVVAITSIGIHAQTLSSGAYRPSPLPTLKSATEANAAITNQFSQFANVKTNNPTEAQAVEMMKRARILGEVRQVLNQKGASAPCIECALFSIFVNNVEHPLQLTYDQKVDAYYNKQWPQEFTDVVNILKK